MKDEETEAELEKVAESVKFLYNVGMLEDTLESLSARFKIDCLGSGRTLEGFHCMKLDKVIEYCPPNCVRYEKVRRYPNRSWK